MKIKAVCSSNLGKIRQNNEDNIYFAGSVLNIDNKGTDKEMHLLINTDVPVFWGVFDGMGGEANGEWAAYLAANVLAERVKKGVLDNVEQFLLDVCLEANQAICKKADELHSKGMGTTAAIICCWKDDIWICNIGDSRIYCVTNQLEQLSVDHTDALFLQEQGIKNRRPTLMQHLGIEAEEMKIEPYISHRKLNRNDCFLICSDGVTDMLGDSELEKILKWKWNLHICARMIEKKAIKKGGADNLTLIMCKVK